jgi:hypothetical protein
LRGLKTTEVTARGARSRGARPAGRAGHCRHNSTDAAAFVDYGAGLKDRVEKDIE